MPWHALHNKHVLAAQFRQSSVTLRMQITRSRLWTFCDPAGCLDEVQATQICCNIEHNLYRQATILLQVVLSPGALEGTSPGVLSGFWTDSGTSVA